MGLNTTDLEWAGAGAAIGATVGGIATGKAGLVAGAVAGAVIGVLAQRVYGLVFGFSEAVGKGVSNLVNAKSPPNPDSIPPSQYVPPHGWTDGTPYKDLPAGQYANQPASILDVAQSGKFLLPNTPENIFQYFGL